MCFSVFSVSVLRDDSIFDFGVHNEHLNTSFFFFSVVSLELILLLRYDSFCNYSLSLFPSVSFSLLGLRAEQLRTDGSAGHVLA